MIVLEIDHCTACGGVWLDAGELELLLDGAANKNALMASLSTGAASIAAPGSRSVRGRRRGRAASARTDVGWPRAGAN